ncbi:hypothetical protein N7456_000456 [Penicillium angulare]|uniref:Uncharacterized protein n=1 Tax=Penicillium angulare TaxID=116970 RepID=A0A9W9GDJ7_9EURO|nr:hypothetical protein N7456_000456 [Penicillium angulare]
MKKDTWIKKVEDDSPSESYLSTTTPKPKMGSTSLANETFINDNSTNVAMPEFKLDIDSRDNSNSNALSEPTGSEATKDSSSITPMSLPPTRPSTLYFCPFHNRHVHHSPEACYINPKNQEQRRINAATALSAIPTAPGFNLYVNRDMSWVAAYGRFKYWESITYPGTAPTQFVNKWIAALDGLSYESDYRVRSMFPIFQFLKAVGACNETHAWLSSLHIDADINAAPRPVLDSIINKFTTAESARLQIQQGPRTPIPVAPNGVENQFPPPGNPTMIFCPFHRRYVYHSMADCHLNPHRTVVRSGAGYFTPYNQQAATCDPHPSVHTLSMWPTPDHDLQGWI